MRKIDFFLLFLCGIIIQAALMKDNTKEDPFRGEKILSDATLFPKEFIKGMNIKLSVWREMVKSNMERGSFQMLFPAPDPSPNIELIKKKYGKPDNVVEKKSKDIIAGSKLKEDATIYWYGRIGFLVAKDKKDIKGMIVTIILE